MEEAILVNTRYSSIDFIKCFAAFAIVCIHTKPFYQATIVNDSGEYIFFIINTLAKFAVPFFFIVSGYLFGKKMVLCKNDTKYFLKYSIKIARLYFGWTFFYFLYNIGVNLASSYIKQTKFHSELIPQFSIVSFAKVIVQIFYTGYAGGHLWYLIALLWSIAILFIFVKYQKINTLLLVSFALNIVGLFGNSYQGIIHFPIPTRDAMFFGLFYCTLGCYFAYHEKTIQQKISNIKTSYFICLLLVFCGLQIIERAILIKYFSGKISHDFFITTIPLSVSLFLFALAKKHVGNRSYLTVIGEKAVGIYVVHLFFIDIIASVGNKLNLDSNTVIYQLLFTPLVFAVSYFAYKGLQYTEGKLELFVNNFKNVKLSRYM